MKEQIETEDIKKLNHDGMIFCILLIATVVLVIPLFLYLDFTGIEIWFVLYGVTMYYAMRLERQKKAHDIQTYKEILAFTDGKRLDEIEKNREYEKRPYQKALLVILVGLVTVVIELIAIFILFC